MSRADALFRRAAAADQRVFGETVSFAGAEVPAIVERSVVKVEPFGMVDAERIDATIEIAIEHDRLASYGVLVALSDGTRWLLGSRIKRDGVSAIYALKEDI